MLSLASACGIRRESSHVSRRPQKGRWGLKHQDQWDDPVSMGYTLHTSSPFLGEVLGLCEYGWERTTNVCNFLFTLAVLASGYLQHGPQCTGLSQVPSLLVTSQHGGGCLLREGL